MLKNRSYIINKCCANIDRFKLINGILRFVLEVRNDRGMVKIARMATTREEFKMFYARD